jgi:nitrate/nitrite-specific signal transduction histidine kinase
VGLNSSYATLADYYKTVNRDSSLAYAYRMKATAEEIESPDDQLQALQKIILLDQEHYRTHFESFQKVYDSVTPARARARNQFALVKSNIRKTALRNAELEALTLRNENRLLVRNILTAISVATVIFVVIFFTLRRRKMLRDRLMEVQNTELKYSKRVHDVVANGIYQVMTKLENHLEISRSETLDDLEDIYHQSRNISYTPEETQEDSTAFKEKIRKLAGYFNSRDVATILVGNDAETWQNISAWHKAEVYQVLRELLINMKKHSHASRVTLRFETSAENLTVHYADNGIGIGTDPVFKNGTRNMVNRMEKINGRITFEKNPEKGLQVSITIPLH